MQTDSGVMLGLPPAGGGSLGPVASPPQSLIFVMGLGTKQLHKGLRTEVGVTYVAW